MAFVPSAYPIQPLGPVPCARPVRPIRAFLFDTYGTVCDFLRPLTAAFAGIARQRGIDLDAKALAVEWRNAYARATFLSAGFGMPFRPLKELHRENLLALMAEHLSVPLTEEEIAELLSTWNRLEPWPDTVAGLHRLKRSAIIAPLSNGNFDDMVHLARHAGLPWDIILGASVAQAYKPHPDIYLKSVAALCLEPADVCMVAAHQVDLAYAAGHGMHTAFVIRRDEFGGAIKPPNATPPEDWLSAAEVHPEAQWTFVAEDFLDLAAQVENL